MLGYTVSDLGVRSIHYGYKIGRIDFQWWSCWLNLNHHNKSFVNDYLMKLMISKLSEILTHSQINNITFNLAFSCKLACYFV